MLERVSNIIDHIIQITPFFGWSEVYVVG